MLENVNIRPFCSHDLSDFKGMFCTYFRSDVKINISDQELESVCHEIADRSLSCSIYVDVLLVDEKSVGFVIYQIDNPKSDWCEREGWGFIREIYIHGSFRGNGLGAQLVAHTETALYEKGAEHIYLTCDEAAGFWNLRGYRNSGHESTINHIPIYEK
jgi:GNAT superfamily N-acetyltransferase